MSIYIYITSKQTTDQDIGLTIHQLAGARTGVKLSHFIDKRASMKINHRVPFLNNHVHLKHLRY